MMPVANSVGWLRGRFGQLAPREQMLIAVALTLGIGTAGYTQLWLPLTESRTNALADIARLDAAMLKVRAAGDRIAPPIVSVTRPLPSVIAETAPRFAVPVQRIEPEGDRLRVTIETVSFDALLRWVADLEATHAVIVTEARIERQPEPGVISADLTLER